MNSALIEPGPGYRLHETVDNHRQTKDPSVHSAAAERGLRAAGLV